MNPLILYTSSLTDTRVLERELKRAGRAYRIEQMGMGDAEMRRRFEALCQEAGVRRLPLIQDGKRWMGEMELLDELRGGPERLPGITSGLGYAGLIPFVTGAMAVGMDSAWVEWWLSYALLILGFMAGTQWGAALGWRDAPASFWVRSVCAPLIAWPLAQLDAVFQAWGLALLFGALLALDRHLQQAGSYPRGYFRLRQQLSALVMISLATGALLMDL